MPKQEKPEPFLPFDMQQSFNLFSVAAEVGYLCVAPFTRHGQGQRSIGWYGFLSLALMMAWCRSYEMEMYIYAWVFMVWVRKHWYARDQDSFYQGRSILAFFVRDQVANHLVEAGMVWGIGTLLPENLGSFISFCSFPMFLKAGIEMRYFAQKRIAIRDQKIRMAIMQQELEEWG